ncbi:hypothetical protein AN640_08750 [Candidatus Epulonipiscium fishelsonii]|uniref:Uncharacterized protein n=1 Tax=Candidatus Epulonipiscium fishelsonii TaxID=77094 RepID=A0ACC8XCK4_9FIRM|nr:hypothetical protein AN640_08750 [Epulopiscium sp. SCG-D08WGA-EpuloA1]OON96491.1 MAG: hypothetical protein ATN32_06365 [Epulopiscium sp. AS2M-Bin002]
MRLVETSSFLMDKKLIVNIYDTENKLVLKRGTILGNREIRLIKNLRYHYIFIKDNYCVTKQKQIFSKETGAYIAQITQEFYAIAFDCMEKGGITNLSSFISTIKLLVNSLKNQHEKDPLKIIYIPNNLVPNSMISNTIVTAINCGIFGIILGFDNEKTVNLVLSDFLKDIGVFSEKIAKKEEASHTLIGYKHLQQYHNLDKSVLDAVMQHHEVEDGTGYPQQLRNNDIVEFAKIIQIVNFHTNFMYSHEILGCGANSLKDTLEPILKKFNQNLLNTFVQNTNFFMPDTMFKLSNYDMGILVKNNPNNLLKPIIQVIDNFSGKFAMNQIVDLTTISDVELESIEYFFD